MIEICHPDEASERERQEMTSGLPDSFALAKPVPVLKSRRGSLKEPNP
jgi:hypothetical protein